MGRSKIVGDRKTSAKLIDTFGREIDYLRISVTDRCDLRCRYCMPAEGADFLERSRILSYEQIEILIQAFVELGIRKVRITGGEPLVRKDIQYLFDDLGGKVLELSLTTNGTHLSDYVPVLVASGIRRVNISLDTLRKETYRNITGRDSLSRVLGGIDTAVTYGLKIKLNTVVMCGVNDCELTDLVMYAVEHSCDIRFIEVMPQEHTGRFYIDAFMSSSDVQNIVAGTYALFPVPAGGSSTENLYRIAGSSANVGFISPMSRPFCYRCNKLRLLPNGMLKTCLFGVGDINLKEMLEKGFSIDEIKAGIRRAVSRKPRAYGLDVDKRDLMMHRTGG